MPLCLTPHLFKQCGAPFRVIFLLQQFVVHTVQLALGQDRKQIPAQIQGFVDGAVGIKALVEEVMLERPCRIPCRAYPIADSSSSPITEARALASCTLA